MAPSHDRRVSPQQEPERIRQLVCEALKGYQAKVYLLGSHVRDEAHRFSDVDIAILPLQPIPPSLFATLREMLEESDILATVDIIDLSAADDRLRQRVFTEEIRWKGSPNSSCKWPMTGTSLCTPTGRVCHPALWTVGTLSGLVRLWLTEIQKRIE